MFHDYVSQTTQVGSSPNFICYQQFNDLFVPSAMSDQQTTACSFIYSGLFESL